MVNLARSIARIRPLTRKVIAAGSVLVLGMLLYWFTAKPKVEFTLVLENPDPVNTPAFGFGLATFGDDVLVAAGNQKREPDNFDQLGEYIGDKVFLMDGETGEVLLNFQDPDGPSYRQFGVTMTTSGSKIIIGAPGRGRSPSSLGAVHIFEGDLNKPDAGRLLFSLRHPAQQNLDLDNDWFGISLAVIADRIAVGAPGFNKSSGEVVVFDLETGNLLERIANPTKQEVELFGMAISAKDETLLVGATNEHTLSQYLGAAYVFDMGGTTTLKKSVPHPLPEREGADFGSVIAASDSAWLIASPAEDDVYPSSNPAHISCQGSVYMFDPNDFTLMSKLTNPNSFPGAYFGAEICESNGLTHISAPGYIPIPANIRSGIGDAAEWLSDPSGAGVIYSYNAKGRLKLVIRHRDAECAPQFGNRLAATSDGFFATGGYEENRGYLVYRVRIK